MSRLIVPSEHVPRANGRGGAKGRVEPGLSDHAAQGAAWSTAWCQEERQKRRDCSVAWGRGSVYSSGRGRSVRRGRDGMPSRGVWGVDRHFGGDDASRPLARRAGMMRQAPNAAGVQKTAVDRWPVDAALTPVQPSPSLPQSLPSPPDPLSRAWRERGNAWGAVLTGKQWRWCPSRSSAIILSGTGRRVRSWGEAGDWQRFRAGLCGVGCAAKYSGNTRCRAR